MKMQEKIKVLMIGPDRSVHGGISGVVNNYYAAGLDRKIDLYYIGTMVDGTKLRKLFKAMEAYLRFLFQLPKYQIVHVNMSSDSSYYRKSIFIRTARKYGKKIVLHQHGGDFEGFYYKENNDKGRRRIRNVLEKADVFLVLAPVWKEFFGNIINEGKIIVLPNSIALHPLQEKRYGQHKLLFLGRICKTKGVGELLEALPFLKEKYPDIKVYLGGIWEDKELKAIAGQFPDEVVSLGWVSGEEKGKYLSMCDIFVLPSYFEGQPVAVLEAMAASCAVVAAGVGGIPQMIENGINGILVEPESMDALCAGLDKALSDPDLCKRLGEKAREKVKKEFSIYKNMEKLLQIYGEVLKV